MNGSMLQTICLIGLVFPLLGDCLTLSVTPKNQFISEYENAVIDCSVTLGTVQWFRSNGLPKQARQIGGRLIINKIRLEDSGYYLCLSKDSGLRDSAFVGVIPTTPISTWQTRFTPTLGYISTALTITTPYPCLYGICNGTCCEDNKVETLFDCANGQKISKLLVCNRVNDCIDGSDEAKCDPWPSKITVLPKEKVEVFCGDQDKAKAGTLTLECQSVGYPIPVIRWKKYEGHVPSKCTQYSKRGHGILRCPNFEQSDQGAYSCVADNSVKSAESQPKSIAKCNNTINCRGFRVINEEQIEHCLECYCSGKTTQCQSIKSSLKPIEIPFPQTNTEIFAKENGEVLFIPTKTKLFPDSKLRDISQGITYCSLSENDFPEKSFLKSFGRNIIYPRHKRETNFLQKAPDLIIQGNGLSLMYTANLLTPLKGDMMNVAAKFWPGNWHFLDKRTASRTDLMKVLSNVDTLLIRCEYEEGKILSLNKNATITIQSSTITHFPNTVSYVEKCNCPTGYDGLSCETCAAGYKKKPTGNDFVCEKIYRPPPCKEGYVGPNCSLCDTDKGYFRNGNFCQKAVCHPEGSTSVFPNTFKKCNCRERVTGDLCDRCVNGTFYLHKARGCLECWCSGVTNECVSSNLYRTVISNIPRGGYNSSDGRNFWLLPSDFVGNRLTSYGGHLNYTMKYKPNIPKENTYLTVEFLSISDVTLVYTHSTVDTSLTRSEKSWSVPLTETSWRKPDKSPVTRAEFLTVLSRIKAIYIESPYHLSSGQVNLTSSRMSSAIPSGSWGDDLAPEVEQCVCPKGYIGLSCESCNVGYYKKRNGTITECIKCNCPNCDPDFGCQECPTLTYRDNPEEEKMPVCKPCPCNGNAISCEKDDLNQIFCKCKPGFTGMYCENPTSDRNDLTLSISPRIISNKKVGATVSFNCSVISNEEMKLSSRTIFQKNSKNESVIFLGQGDKVVKQFDVVLEDGTQSVECFVRDAAGNVAGHVVAMVDIIEIFKPPKITNCYADKIEVKESESRDIICEATGFPTPTINWYKSKNGSSAQKVDTLDGVHTIESVSTYENGTMYTCVAENAVEKSTCTRVLIVRKKCEIVLITPKSVKITEGESASIQCKTTANSSVHWHQFDTHTRLEKTIISPRIKVQTESGVFLIVNASLSDSGTYICTATGEDGKINQTISVTVEEKRVLPSATIQEYDKTLKVGESFNVNCIVSGKPTPTVTWTKLNDSLETNVHTYGKTLTITKATLKNSGAYECEARSIAGKASSYISIDVEYPSIPPRVNISEENIKAEVGEEVTISCLATGYPRPKLSWFGSKINITRISRESDNMVLINPLESVKEVVKFKVGKEHEEFLITCQAESVAGKDQKSVKIKVLQPTGGTNETVEFVPIGSHFELLCDLPGNLTWNKVGGFPAGGLSGNSSNMKRFAEEGICVTSYGLLITSVQVQHNGTYICRDSSGTEKVMHLIVVGFVPKFSKEAKSYLILPVRLNSDETRIELTFSPTHENGMLLQEESGKLEIYLKKRAIHLSLYCKNGDFVDLVMPELITLGKWYSLVVTIRKNYVDITIYNENTKIHGRKTESSKDFEFNTAFDNEIVFVGGPMPMARHARRMFLQRHPHHSDGCISRLSINYHEFDLVKEGSYSHNVSLCRRCAEEEPCGAEGKCLDAPTQRGFICVCPAGQRNRTDTTDTCPASCIGKACETRLDLCDRLKPCGVLHKCTHHINSLQCHCAFGYSGTTCEKVQEYSFCAKGNGYVKLPSMLLERHLGKPEDIRMSLTLNTPNGQLLWQGDKDNHLSIAVHEGNLRYVYLNQNSKLEIHTNGALATSTRYNLFFGRLNSTIFLEVQSGSKQEVYRNSTGAYHTNRVRGDIYLGNTPKSAHHIGHHTGLNGCIHYISFGEKKKINFSEKEVEKLNVSLSPNKYSDYNSDEFDEYDADDYGEPSSGSNEVDFELEAAQPASILKR